MMQHEKCVHCSEFTRCRESSASWVFFIIGIIATIAVRIVTVLAHVSPFYGEVAWYVGVFGFFVFFFYKFKVERARHKLIVERKLMDKLARGAGMEKEDRHLLGLILCALSSNKDRINYMVIFVSSVLALAIAVYLDFIKR